jgi:hypothetical protein
MLATAARIVEATKEDAKREAAALVTRARDEAKQVGRLHDEARAALEAADTEAETILAEVRAEVERVARVDQAEADALTTTARGEAAAMLAAARAEADAMLEAARTESVAMTSGARSERERLLNDATRDAREARAALEQEKTKIDHAIDDLRDTWTGRISDALARLDAVDPGADGIAEVEEAEAANPDGASEADLALELQDRLSGTAAAQPPNPVEEPDAARGE